MRRRLIADEQRGDFVLAAERPRIGVGEALLQRTVGHDDADRLIAGDDLPGRRRSGQRLLEPGALRRSQQRGVGSGLGLEVGGVGPAIGPAVEDEHVGQRAATHDAVDLPRIAAVGADRACSRRTPAWPAPPAPRPASRCSGLRSPAAPSTSVGYQLFRTSWSSHCATIGTAGVERAQVRVAQVVAVAAAELVEGLGDVADAVLDQVAPRRSVVEPHGRGDRPVGVDQVAGVDEQIGLDRGASRRTSACRRASRRCPSPGRTRRRPRRCGPAPASAPACGRRRGPAR